MISIDPLGKAIGRVFDILLYISVRVTGVRGKLGRPHGLPGPLIVSLTSYPPRFRTLSATLISLLNQSTKADEVILWIAHGDMNKLPQSVTSLKKHGLVIRACDDLRSYKKIIPLLEQRADAFVVTADDDIYYPPHWLAELVAAYSDSSIILCHRAHQILLRPDGLPERYSAWTKGIKKEEPSTTIFATGVGGVLYPPASLHRDVLDREAFMKICQYADDIWLYWMARRNGCLVKTVGQIKKFHSWPGSQLIGLHRINTQQENRNDEQIVNMLEKYGWPSSE